MQTPAGTVPVQQRPAASSGSAALWKGKKFIIGAAVVVLALAYLITVGIQSSAMYYLTVEEFLVEEKAAVGQRVRLGGTVAPESVQAVPGSTTLRFQVTDGQRNIPVTYTGIVPDAFRPGGDVILEGALTPEGIFNAEVLLAKCPSKYAPSL
ncbi:MAG: cytochrome c maturation protein CcmE [Chloroflexi bacterium]|nr:cytochrome c maturation protein CcmE [Chloroflexota bacterium]